MSNNTYLQHLIDSQVLGLQEEDVLRRHRDEVELFLREKFGTEPVIKFAGSKAKHTMIKENYDLDIVCYFLSYNTKSLKELHDEVQTTLAERYRIETKASAVRILGLQSGNSDNEGYHIDVVPGRFIDQSCQDAFLHIVYGEKERMQTNIKKHIKTITESGCRELIKLTKLWAHRNNLKFKTFVLELFVIRAMEFFEERDNYEQAFTRVLEQLAIGIERVRLEDPANSKNIVTESMSAIDKKLIADCAKNSFAVISRRNDIDAWKSIFKDQSSEESFNGEGEIVSMQIVGFEDLSHCEKPRWPAASSFCSVHIKCFSKDGEVFSGQGLQIENSVLKYEAVVTNEPVGSEIFWQVVNTGEHATVEKCLRGNFFKAKTIQNTLNSNEKINFEITKYTGVHWVECFVVNNGRMIARSGRFFVNVLNTKLPSFRFQKRRSFPRNSGTAF